MYKVVLIDDEPAVIRSLTDDIPWGRFDCEIAGTAADGEEGLQLIRHCQPDIVITDIRMAHMNGLKMLDHIKEEFPNICVTILTGHPDFEEAQEAIRLGVDRLVLKKADKDQMLEAVSHMAEKLKEREKTPETSLTVRYALDYLNKHYGEKIYLADVAEKAYVSQWYLSRLIRRELGLSFPELVTRVRIRKAMELLRDPSLQISTIAEMTGFSDPAHFSRAFRRATGISATQFRKQGGVLERQPGEEPGIRTGI